MNFIEESKAKLDTHYYDNSIFDLLPPIQDLIDWGYDVKPSEKMEYFIKIRDKLEKYASPCFDLMVTQIHQAPNFFHIYADDVLYLLARHIESESHKTYPETIPKGKYHKIYETMKKVNKTHLMDNINKQFIEMQTGACPQGRVNRLVQLLLSFEDDIRAEQIADDIENMFSHSKCNINLSWSSRPVPYNKKKIKHILYLAGLQLWLKLNIIVDLDVECNFDTNCVKYIQCQKVKKEPPSKEIIDKFMNDIDTYITQKMDGKEIKYKYNYVENINQFYYLLLKSQDIVFEKSAGELCIDHIGELVPVKSLEY